MEKMPILYAATISIGAVLLFFLIQILSYGIIYYLLPNIDNGQLLSFATLLTGMMILLLLWTIKKYLNEFGIVIFDDFLFSLKSFGIGIVYLVLFLLFCQLLLSVFDNDPLIFMDEFVNVHNWILLGFCLVVIVPIYEELLFRGFILSVLTNKRMPISFCHFALTKNWQQWFGIFMTSFLFSLSHLQYDWIGFLLIFLLSGLLCFLKLKYQSIGLPIVLHSLNNLWAFYDYANEKLW